MKKISVLGSTGSIGVNTLDVAERNPSQFKIVALAGGNNIEVLADQINKFRPKLVSVLNPENIDPLKKAIHGTSPEILSGEEGAIAVASVQEVEMVVSAIVGGAGLAPTFAAIQNGKDIALANKETLVIAGEVVLKAARGKCEIIPVDSEHSAILQALNGENQKRVKKIILTASGGPFRTYTLDQMEEITVSQALKHPNWAMGAKITIDSATMMNKGLEYIEAKWLFGLDTPVEIVVHPQSIIHSMVEFTDTSIMAQLGLPDMRVPIAYALSYPDRFEADLPSLDFTKLARMDFEAPDFEKFPCLKLAFRALEAGQSMPAILNAANEIAVQGFLDEKIAFKEIPEIIKSTMDNHVCKPINDIKDVLEADRWAREEATKLLAVPH
jgi:1-deoxy-D-xylulose-5-phosphate reductoisomerase